MSFLSNLKLSFEDDELMEAAPVEPIEEVSVDESVQDEIDNSSETEEFQETVVAAEEDIAEMDKQEEVLEGLQEQDEVIEQKLENPEDVTPEDVVVAQEAFAFALGRLCSGQSDYKEFRKSVKVSYESNNNNPAAVLYQLHQEGFKDFIMKIIQSIRALFTRIMNWFKKLMVKIVIMFDQSEKTLKKMADVIQKESNNEINVNEWQKVAKKRLGAALYVVAADKQPQSFEAILRKSNSLTSLCFADRMIKEMVNMRATEGVVKKLFNLIGNLFKNSRPDGHLEYISFAGHEVISLKAIKTDDSDSATSITFRVESIKVDKDPNVAGIRELNNATKYSSLLKIVNFVSKYASDIKKFSKNVEDNSKELQKAFNNLEKEKDANGKDILPIIYASKIGKIMLSHGVLGAIKTHTSCVRGSVAILAAAMKPIKN